MSQQITEHDFFKSLERLEALAKGSDEGQDLNKAQICSGKGNEPQSWAGGDKDKLGDNWDDSIAADGTDYKAGAKARKSIAEKILKGEALDASEIGVISGDIDSVSKAVPPAIAAAAAGDADADDDDDDKKPVFDDKDKDKDKDKGKDEGPLPLAMGKSFGEVAQANETVQKGIEVSDFLLELTKSFALGLQGLEQKITHNIVGHLRSDLGSMAKEQGEFNKSLADAVCNIGHGLTGVVKGQEDAGNAPAGAPRTQLRAVPTDVKVLNKSQGAPQDTLTKSQILGAMTDLVEKGQCSPLDVIKYESTGDLAPHMQEAVSKSLGR